MSGDLEEVRCPVAGLKIGMYVSRLDRPWIETPFLMAGFKITSEQEIADLQKFCRYVFIDVDAGVEPEPEFSVSRQPPKPTIHFEMAPSDAKPAARTVEQPQESRPPKESKQAQQQKYAQLRRQVHAPLVSLQEELSTAQEIHRHLHDQTSRILTNLQSGYRLDMEQLREDIHDTVESILRNPSALMLLVQLEKSDEYAYNHALGTSVWCAEFGRHLGLDKQHIRELALGGMLLDVGKTQLPHELFAKRDFDAADRELIRTHVDHSMKLLTDTHELEPSILDMVATHHERYDGTGYPKHLRGDGIPLYGRIAGLVDCYDAMTTQRPYTEKVLSPHQAISQIYSWRDSLFEGELIEQFIQSVGIYPAGSLVELDSGEVGVVVSINNEKKLLPSLLLLLDTEKQRLAQMSFLDLAKSGKGRRIVRGHSVGAFGIEFDEIEVESLRAF